MEDKDKCEVPLTAEQILDYRIWARRNFSPHSQNIDYSWHPIVIQECEIMIQELKQGHLPKHN